MKQKQQEYDRNVVSLPINFHDYTRDSDWRELETGCIMD